MSAPIHAAVWALSIGAVLSIAGPTRAEVLAADSAVARGGGAPAFPCTSPGAVEPILACDGLIRSNGRPARHLALLETSSRAVAAAEQRRANEPAVEIDVASLQMRPALARKASELLAHEISVLRRLAKNTRRASKQRPGVLERLAEALLEAEEQARAQVRALDEPLFVAERAEQRESAQRLKREQDAAEQRLRSLRTERIEVLNALCDDHPRAPRMDQQLFALAFALDEAGQFERSRQTYARLVREHPASPLLYNAYLAFAEHHFAQGAFALAKDFYGKVLEAPASQNPYFGFALYKLAWCEQGLDNYPEAVRWFMAVLRLTREQPQQPLAQSLARQVLRELVLPYARSGGSAKDGLGFFWDVAGGGEQQALALYESLATLYFDQGEWEQAIFAYTKLLARQPESPSRCTFEFRLSSAELALGHRERGVEHLEALVREWERWRARAPGTSVERSCKEQAVLGLWDLAVSFHREGVGTQGSPGTKNARSLSLAARLYQTLIDTFPDLEQLALAETAGDQRPTAYEVRYYYAEALWSLERWSECGPAFDRVVELDPGGPRAADAAFASLLCYSHVYEQELASRERQLKAEPSARRRKEDATAPAQLVPRALSSDEQSMARSFSRYLCVAPDAADAATVKYRRARLYYEANHFEEAARLFREVALAHPESEWVDYAANLYLDSLNALASRVAAQPRSECYDELSTAVTELSARYCEDAAAVAEGEHAELCGPLVQLRCDIERKAAEARGARGEHRDAALAYLRIYREGESCRGKDELLYNAAIHFEAGKLVGRAIKVRTLLRDRYPESRLAPRSLYLIGSAYQALALYGNAADSYEQFATRYPEEEGQACSERERQLGLCARAQDALRDAVFFRLGLGDDARALEDGRLYHELFGKKHAREASEVAFALGSTYERARNWSEIERHYRDYLRTYERVALPHEAFKAQTMVGVALFKLGEEREAVRWLSRARSAWQAGLSTEIAKAAGDRSELAARWSAEARESAAQAFFYLGEVRRGVFERFLFPELEGHASLQNVNRWAQGAFAKWIKRKSRALAKAEQAYGEVRQLSVPIWDIAAASRVGVMYRSFVDDFRDAPVPAEIRADPELMDIYLGSLDEKSEPWLQEATAAFELCMGLATRIRWFNEYSQQCELELYRLDPRRFPQSSELRGAAQYMAKGAALPLPAEREARVPEGIGAQDAGPGGEGGPASPRQASSGGVLDVCVSRDDPLCFELP